MGPKYRRSVRQAEKNKQSAIQPGSASPSQSKEVPASPTSSTAEQEIKRSRGGSSPILDRDNKGPDNDIKLQEDAASLEHLVHEIQEETINFEAMVQGKHAFSSPAATASRANESSKSSTLLSPGEKKTLFHHGFNKLQEQLMHVSNKVITSASKNQDINPYPSQEEQDAYIKKHGGDKNFVSGIKINFVKVEDGTFAAMDKDTADTSDESTCKKGSSTINSNSLPSSPSSNLSENEDTSAKPTKNEQSLEDDSRLVSTNTSEGPSGDDEENNTNAIASTDSDKVAGLVQNSNEQSGGQNESAAVHLQENSSEIKEDTTQQLSNQATPSPTDDIEFPPNDDNLPEEAEESATSSRRQKKKPARRKKSKNSRVAFSSSTLVEIEDDASEDSRNTIDSDQASFNISAAEGRRQIPPPFVRYRVGILLDTEDLIENTSAEASEQTSPSDRYKALLKDLVACVHNLDNNALFVTWKNNPTFKVLSSNPDDFPTRAETIAAYFEGYTNKLKAGNKKFFQFCIHSPALSNSSLETELGEWGRANSLTIYECNLQAETSKVIGWLVYSMPFTNTNHLKRYMKGLSGHEWGFKYSTFTSTDKKLDWKLRSKALEIMVPAEHENSARALISSTFKQRPSTNTHKSFTECYIYVGHERDKMKQMKCLRENELFD